METNTSRTPRRLLGVWAHPDDEAYLSAGLMGRVIDAGGSVTLVTATDGELGFPDDDPRPTARRAACRRDELRVAMGVLGIDDIRFLGHPDGRLDDVDPALLVDCVRSTIEEVRPDTIVTFGPDGVTGHPDHLAICAATTRAWIDAGIGELSYACHPAPWWDTFAELHRAIGLDEPAGGRVEPGEVARTTALSGAELDRKRAVLVAHASQTIGLAGLVGEADYRRWIATEWTRRPRSAEIDRTGTTVGVG